MKLHLNLFNKQQTNDYFKQAQSWVDDRFGLMEASRARYKLAFIIAMLANSCLAITVSTLIPLQRVEPLVIHQYDNGVTTVDAPSPTLPALNRAQIESDIVRYIVNRESFDATSYRSQYDLVVLLSNHAVSLQYQAAQKSTHPHAPINVLGNHSERRIHIYNINFLDQELLNQSDFKKNHHNIAEVVFDRIDIDKVSGKHTRQSYNALLSWHYTTTSNNPALRWKNWDGFEVTSYHIQLRNVKEQPA